MDYIKFQKRDAWILLTIPLNNEGTDLQGVIGRADAINKLIPSDEEIEGAINRFLKTGIIKYENNNFILMNEYTQIIKNIYDEHKIIFDVWGELEFFLMNKEWPLLNADLHYKLAKDESRIAYQNYSKWFWKTFKEISKKDKNKKKITAYNRRCTACIGLVKINCTEVML